MGAVSTVLLHHRACINVFLQEILLILMVVECILMIHYHLNYTTVFLQEILLILMVVVFIVHHHHQKLIIAYWLAIMLLVEEVSVVQLTLLRRLVTVF